MFDLIDDLDTEKWDDKGSPPSDLNQLENFSAYEDLHIVSRKPHPTNPQITFVVSDITGKHKPRNAVVRGIKKVKVDPLKNVRHFHAIVEEMPEADENNSWLVKEILLDMDHVVLKE